jgi:tRNA/rRNA methyltransferase
MTAIVLVEPSLPENVGAVARAMGNFGLYDLRVVAPAFPVDHARAVAAATHGEQVLRAARTYGTLAEALAGRRRVWATTARLRETVLPVIGPRALGAALRAAEAAEAAPALVFGPERTGLRFEHLERADALVHIPTDPACPALNLAQSVLLCAWERWAADDTPEQATGPLPAPKESFDAWFSTLEEGLDRVGYLSEPALRVRALRTLRSALSRAGFSEQELGALHGVIRALGRPPRQ